MDFDFERDTSINKFLLDDEQLRQSELAMKYGRANAEANLAVDKAKLKVKVAEDKLKKVAADIALSIVAKSEKKPSDPTIDKMVLMDNKYQLVQRDLYAAMEELSEAKYQADLMFAAVMAINQKRESIPSLYQMHKDEYFSKPFGVEGNEPKNKRSDDFRDQIAGLSSGNQPPSYSSQVSGLNSSKKTCSEPAETFQSIPKKSFETPAQILKAAEKDFQPNPDPLLESIVSLAVTTAQEPTHKYAIGWEDSRRGYAVGPFDTEEQAYRNVGEDGMLLLKLGVGGAATPLAFWSEAECGWLPISEKTKGMKRPSPVPRPAPLKVK